MIAVFPIPMHISSWQVRVVSCRWSYGVLLWEIFAFGETPYTSIPVESLSRLLQTGYRMPRPSHAAQHVSAYTASICTAPPPQQQLIAHTRTVVRQRCKDDDQSQWGKGKIWPPANPKPRNGSSRKFAPVITSWTSTSPRRTRGFVSAHARLGAPDCSLGYFFAVFVLPIAHSQDAHGF